MTRGTFDGCRLLVAFEELRAIKSHCNGMETVMARTYFRLVLIFSGKRWLMWKLMWSAWYVEVNRRPANCLITNRSKKTSIWTKILNGSGVFPNRVRDHFTQSLSLLYVVNGRKFSVGVWDGVLWVIWRCGNKLLFKKAKGETWRIY